MILYFKKLTTSTVVPILLVFVFFKINVVFGEQKLSKVLKDLKYLLKEILSLLLIFSKRDEV